MCVCKEEIIDKLQKILDNYIEKIGMTGKENYNSELDNICCDLINLKFELEDNK